MEKVVLYVGATGVRILSLPIVIVVGMIVSIFSTLSLNYDMWKKDMKQIKEV